jgi:endonuclease YncB( thermonuclease family)
MKRLLILICVLHLLFICLIGCAATAPMKTSAPPHTTPPKTSDPPPALEPLEITSITPEIVHADGGTAVSISGAGFNTGTTVYITQRDYVKHANSLFTSSSTLIFCRIPPNDIGFAHITVVNENGDRATLTDGVIYTKLGFEWSLLTKARVVRVIDGDTIEVIIDNRMYDVRYIGIDTPETMHSNQGEEPYGKEASEKNSELVEGKVVLLEKDVSKTDQYGRLLRYVYVNDKFINAELVRLGYAHATSYPPDIKYQELFLKFQREAKEHSLGLWGIDSPNSPLMTTDTSNIQITQIFYDGLVPKVESDEYVEIYNLGNKAVDLTNWVLKDITEGYPSFTFPRYILKPGVSIRVYTNEVHPEYAGFSFTFQKAIWNNINPDTAVLYDAQGNEVCIASY